MFAVAFVLAALVAACGGTTDGITTPDATTTATEPQTSEAPTASPTPPPDPGPTELPPSEPPLTPEPESASPATGSSATCSGTPENRDFFAAVADAVSWPVYCPVLSDGWFVDSGQYGLAGGAWMEVSYRGPGGARIELREGAICGRADCDLDGADLGAADFGTLAGVIYDQGGGRYEVVVDPGASPSWVLLVTGLSEADARTIAARLTLVEG